MKRNLKILPKEKGFEGIGDCAIMDNFYFFIRSNDKEKLYTLINIQYSTYLRIFKKNFNKFDQRIKLLFYFLSLFCFDLIIFFKKFPISECSWSQKSSAQYKGLYFLSQ
jgi:hypothetical protein